MAFMYEIDLINKSVEPIVDNVLLKLRRVWYYGNRTVVRTELYGCKIIRIY